MTRSAEKVANMKQKFGNLPEDKLLIVEGNVGENLCQYKAITRIVTGTI